MLDTQDRRKVLGQPFSQSNCVYTAIVIPMSAGQKMKTKRNLKRSRSIVGRFPEPGLVAVALFADSCEYGSESWASRVDIGGAVADVCAGDCAD